MVVTNALLGASVVTIIGSLILWSNPRRIVNRVVFTCSLHLAAWLLALHLAVTMREGLFWLRTACAIGASVPLHFWIVKESISTEAEGWLGRVARRCPGWVLVTVLLTITPYTEIFIPSHSTGDRRIFGWGYYGYIIVDMVLYVSLMIDAYRTTRRVTGSRKMELQVWLLGGCLMTSLILVLMALNAVTHDPRYIRPQPFVLLTFYLATAVAITTYRIFDARQLLRVAGEKLLLVSLTATGAYVAYALLGPFLPNPLDIFVTTALALWLAAVLNGALDRRFQFFPHAAAARKAALDAARRESRAEGLEQAFLSVLRGWGQSEHAVLLVGTRGALRGQGVELEENCIAVTTLRQLRWATPERLAREKSSTERATLATLLEANKLGVAVVADGPALSVLIGVGLPASRRPFTYPQATQLIELASIMEGALERAHFSVKAQHAEQLATVGLLGAGLAHEIRNPLVSIKTFVQLLPTHHQDPAFRDKFFRLIGDEVNRIDRLTEQLLDLASPRVYQAQMLDLHPVLREGIDLAATKAAGKRIQFFTEFEASPDKAFTDASAVKQVFLNLTFNAIQAVEQRSGERWVKVITRNVPTGIEVAVSDSGPGIAPEIRPRLFQPFQSTKSTGFGLGLAICSDILAGLSATITVDPPAPNRGATFRVTLPCQPS